MSRAGVVLEVVDGAPRSGASREADATEVPPHRGRIIDATLACLARHGTAKTTVDDIARGAGVSRATVYRVFPGGREEILAAVLDTEVARLFAGLGVCLGEAEDLPTALVEGIAMASTAIRDHPALQYLMTHEPELLLTHLAFDEAGRLFHVASTFCAPFLARWMAPDEAARVGEWATRIVLSYAIAPSADLDLRDPAAADRLVRTFVLPGIRALHRCAAPAAIAITPFDHPAPSTAG